jgi:hypothetical protein
MSGRARYKTHGGIPQGSTNALGSNLSFYMQWKADVAVGQWDDQSSNANHMTQATSGDQAAIAADWITNRYISRRRFCFMVSV